MERQNKPYRRTRESTRNILKLDLEHSRQKKAVDAVFTKRGGIVSSQRTGELLRGRSQAYNLKKEVATRAISSIDWCQGYHKLWVRDARYVVMEQCKNAEKTFLL